MKKLFSVALVVLLVAGVLAGCGGSKSGGSKSDEIKIGGNLELSGNVASYGESIAKGVEMAIEEINAAGGVDGKKLKWVKVDNKSDAAEASSVAIRLIDQEKVTAIIGAATSGNTKAQLDKANSSKTVVLSPSGTAASVTINEETGKLNEYAFRTTFIDPFQGEVGANFAINELGAKTAAVYIETSSDYSKGLAASFIETFEALGGSIVAEEAYVEKDTEFRSTLTRIKSANPDFVYVPGYYNEVGLIIKQARELGLNVPFMGGEGWESDTLVGLAGKDALEDTYYTNAYSTEIQDPIVQKFVSDFKAKYNAVPDAFAALGYDSVLFLADALKRSGGEGGEKLKKAMEETNELKLVTGTLKLDANHDPIKAAAILEYLDGVAKFKQYVNP